MNDGARGGFGSASLREARAFRDPAAALARVQAIYADATRAVNERFARFAAGERIQDRPAAFYPYVGIDVPADALNIDARVAYGAVLDPGRYGTTLTRPDLFGDYYREQFELLIHHHGVDLVVGISDRPVPLPFVVERAVAGITEADVRAMQQVFALPDLSLIDDTIANGTHRPAAGEPRPLALFPAERVDYSLQRLRHYTATDPGQIQRFVLLTNYQRYVEAFRVFARERLAAGDGYDTFVEPGDVVTRRSATGTLDTEGVAPAHLPQMPAYHLVRPDRSGITLVNIGVGPSNAKTITDHLAVLRPHCWIMVGHCAGLRRSQFLGDYVLAHAYVREDGVLDRDLPPWVSLPAIAEVQVALQQAVENVTGLSGGEMKTRMRTGTVFTIDDRNWELRYSDLFERLNQTRAIAVDMESATIAANGFRFRVPYGTLLCVSDKPLHGEIKLPGMASRMYQDRVDQHLLVGIRALELLREVGVERLHSRKLRSFDEPAFR
ncbi:MAG: AMP nucleosidase [Alphaproteobacteria bacterium]|nr:AMP nucleosidase [Alphaproteobacteria bacterium]